MIINRIAEDTENLVIKKEKIPNGCNIYVKAGAGKRGDGLYGGFGGYGQVKSIYFNGLNDITIKVHFEKKAKDGSSIKISNGITNIYELQGGIAGKDVDCLIKVCTEEIKIHCNGGGGGGASGQSVYLNHNQKYEINGMNGGENSLGELNYSAFMLNGGRGQDGVPGSFFNEVSNQFISEFPYNDKDAEVIVEVC